MMDHAENYHEQAGAELYKAHETLNLQFSSMGNAK